jgi:peptidyl-prolyl cis-trans isomerase SurA
VEGSTQASSSSNTDPNPLEAHAVVEGKTRYSARAKQVSAEKKTAKLKKVKEKVAAGPLAASADEKAAEQTQAAPLGLNGDTSKKKKKQPKDKNAPKERLQNKAPTPPPPPPDETPSKAPNRATPLEGTVPPAPKTPDTTVPPATAPGAAPTAPPQQ